MNLKSYHQVYRWLAHEMDSLSEIRFVNIEMASRGDLEGGCTVNVKRGLGKGICH